MAQLKLLDGTDVYIWKYLPSVPAAVVFLLLFTATTSAICWRIAKARSWFCTAFALGGIFQVIGYATRIYCHYYTNLLAPYAIQSTFILIPPVFYAASIYMALHRLIRSVQGERFSIIRPTRLTKLFVAIDFLALSVQGDGAGLTVQPKNRAMGQYIVIAGLFIQLIGFGFFVVAALVFDMRMRVYVAKGTSGLLHARVPWRQGLRMLYACSALIMVRSVFRVIEYLMGVDGYLLSHEWPMYIFDAVLMWSVQVIFLIWFPSELQAPQVDGSEDGNVLVGVNTQ